MSIISFFWYSPESAVVFSYPSTDDTKTTTENIFISGLIKFKWSSSLVIFSKGISNSGCSNIKILPDCLLRQLISSVSTFSFGLPVYLRAKSVKKSNILYWVESIFSLFNDDVKYADSWIKDAITRGFVHTAFRFTALVFDSFKENGIP